MGAVYRARHPDLGRDVAIKVLLAGGRANATQRERFQREARAAARLRHPSIVAIHDVGDSDLGPFIVMDLIDGESLAAVVAASGPLPPREAAAALAEVAAAVHHAHEHLILHRDLKPENVLRTSEGRYVLTDFGLAKLIDDEDDSSPTRTGGIIGTPAFMAPEQARGDLADPRTDVYGLGATLYALLTGTPPLNADSILALLAMLARIDPAPPSRARPGIDRDLDTICLRCLEKEPARRYPHAEALAADLHRWLRHEPILARPPSLGDRARKWTRRNPLTATVGGVALTALALGAVGVAVWTARERAAAAVRAADERERAVGETRAALAADARTRSELAAAALTADDAADPGRRLGLALAAVQTAQRWHERAPRDPAAARASFDAALALGEVALATEQWDLAAEAFSQALGLGVDEVAAAAAVARVDAARRADAERRRAAVEAIIADIASGDASRRPDGATDAVFSLARLAGPDVVALLVTAFDAVIDELFRIEREVYLSAAEPDEDEARAGGTTILGLEDAIDAHHRNGLETDHRLLRTGGPIMLARTRLISRARRDARDPHQRVEHGAIIRERQAVELGSRLDLLPTLAEAIGRIGLPDDAAFATLERHLGIDRSWERAVPSAIAIGRLGGARSRDILQRAAVRWGLDGPLHRRIAAYVESDGAAVKTGEPPSSGPDADGDPDALKGQAKLAEAAGRRRDAIALYEQVLAMRPSDYFARLGIAICLRGLGDADGELAALEQLVADHPTTARAYASRALARMSRGDHEGALADSERIVELEPNAAWAWNDRANCLRTDERLDEALASYDRCLELDPDRAESRMFRGWILHRLDRHERALEDLDRAVAALPDDSPALEFRSRVLAALHRLDPALEDADRAIAISPDRPELFRLRGMILGRLGRLVEARVAFDRAIALGGETARLLADRTQLHLSAGEHEAARATADRAVALGGADGLIARAAVLARTGDFEGALADTERAIELEPGVVSHRFERAGLLRRLGRRSDSLAEWNRVVEASPSDFGAYANRAIAHHELRDLTEALADADCALELAPHHAGVHMIRSGILVSSGDDAGALASLDRAVELDPAHGSAFSRRAEVRSRMGDHEGALADADRAVALAPRDFEIWSVRAWIRWIRGERDEALADWDRSLEIAPDATMPLGHRSQARSGRKDLLDGALADAERLVELAPDQARSWLLRGYAHERRGELAEAEADWARACEMSSSAWNWAALANLRRRAGDAAGARAAVERARSIDAGNPTDLVDQLVTRADAEVKRGDRAGALRFVEIALGVAPDDARALSRRAELLLDEGADRATAAAELERAVAASPEDPALRVRLAGLLIERGDPDAALAHLDAALEAAPDHPGALYTRGLAHAAEDRNEAARRDLERALAAAPNHDLAHEARLVLGQLPPR